MTVKELIELLKRYPEESEVECTFDGNCASQGICGVYEYETGLLTLEGDR